MEYNSDFFSEKGNDNSLILSNDNNFQQLDFKTEKDFTRNIQNYHNKKLYKNMEKLCINFKKKYKESPNPYYFLGLCYYELGELDKSLKFFNKSLSISKSAFCLNNLGLLYIKKNEHITAQKVFKEAYQMLPSNIQICINLAKAYEINGDLLKGYELIKEALVIDENNIEALCILHTMHFSTDEDLLFCLKNLEKLTIKSPEDIIILENLATVLHKLDEYALAMKVSLKLLEIEPLNATRYFNLGTLLKNQGRYKEAKEYVISAIRLDPKVASYWLLLGLAESNFGRIYHAIEVWKKVINLDKYDLRAWAYNNIANAYIKTGETDLAYEFYNKALNSNEVLNYKSQEKIQNNYLCNLGYLSSDIEQIYKSHREFRKIYDDKFQYTFQNKQKYKTNNKIRIGYMSPDFRTHSVSFFFVQLLKFHDKEKFEIYLYSNLEGTEDQTTDLFKVLSCHWRDVQKKSDEELIEIIQDDNINILIDLAGNFRGGRPSIFARKPAPIQVSYLGYVTTTGLKSIDYRFTTYDADPDKQEDAYYTEKLIRLPNTFLCYKGNNEIYSVKNPPCTQGKPITFGSFNNIAKITEQTIKIWSTLLNKIENSILLIKSSVASNETVYEKLIEKFQKYGVNQNRIKSMIKTRFIDDHLKMYNLVDIALDTFPFNGATTTFEALWMGVPVMTINGNIHHSRVSSSILKELDMNFCVAEDIVDFVNKTFDLSKDINKLTFLRTSLRKKLEESNLCNGKLFAENIELEYLKMLKKIN